MPASTHRPFVCLTKRSRAIAAATLISIASLFGLVATAAQAQVAQAEPEYTGDDRVEQWTGKKILVLSPHPDDDVLTSGGTLALLARGGNEIHVVVYTSGNAGSLDRSMTRERLAAIRQAEEIGAMTTLGIDKERIVFLGYDDGMLEYVDQRSFTREVAREIRRVKPDVIFAPDPGVPYVQYHKSDHRAASILSVDAVRAARWRLYFPELEQAGYQAWNVPLMLFYYSAQPNYTVDISAVGPLKAKAAGHHISQFGPMFERYDESQEAAQRKEQEANFAERFRGEDGRFLESFRRSTSY
jgi:LmbE family N-acetylglucosaminyl deacetylase